MDEKEKDEININVNIVGFGRCGMLMGIIFTAILFGFIQPTFTHILIMIALFIADDYFK